jgi:hypothetical protein
MATLPQYKQRQIARRSTSDISKLAKQYKSNLDSITGEYQTAFSGYQAGVTEQMKPYEAQIATYKNLLLPTYETQKTAYKKKLDDYNVLLADLEKNPLIERQGTRLEAEPLPTIGTGGAGAGGPQYGFVKRPYTYYEEKPIPKFTDTAPKTPDIPVAPEIAAFDSTQYEARKTEAGSALKREIGERRASKISAVSRRNARPLLSGAKP